MGEKIPCKDAKIEYKSKAKGRFFFIATSCVLSIGCSSEAEMNNWVNSLTNVAAMFSSYPSNLAMVKKLPTGNAEINCIGVAPNKLILLGLSSGTDIRAVDGMLRSKPSIPIHDSIAGKISVNAILTATNGIWVVANNRILKLHPRTFVVQQVLQEKHQGHISDICISGLELWSCGDTEICCWDIKNGGFIECIKPLEKIRAY